MKLCRKFSYRNLDDMFRLILLIYGEKNVSTFTQDDLNCRIVNFTKKQIFATGLENVTHKLRLAWNSSCCFKETPSKNVQLWQ